MMRKLTLVACAAVVALLTSGCTQLKSRDQLNRGVRMVDYEDTAP